MHKIGLKGTKQIIEQYLPKLKALLDGDWIEPMPGTKIRISGDMDVQIDGSGAPKLSLQINHIPLEVERGSGPCKVDLNGTIDAVTDITPQGAGLVLGGLPDQVLQWLP